ncbi:MAG TPA: hypothetical protein VGQ83_29760 [Polyangia bacterium]|jgi:hypothetical protein
MGSFFTNVQVFRGDHVTTDALVAALQEVAAAEGLVPAAAVEAADRALVVAPAGPRWLAIYDERTESQDVTALEALAAQSSRALETVAVAVLVHDSDVLELRLYERGALVDRYCNRPDYFGKVSKKEKAAAAGHADRWQPLLAADATAEALRLAWAGTPLFVEDMLAKVAGLLGWGEGQSLVGYDSLADTEFPRTTLRLRHAVRPVWEQEVAGPPLFVWNGHTPELDLSVGDPLHVACGVRSAGGSGRGLDVLVQGAALDAGLVTIEHAELVQMRDEQACLIGDADFAGPAGGDRVAHFPDVEIRSGLGGEASGGSRRQEAEAATRRLHVNLAGRVLAAGAGSLSVVLAPREHPDGGCAFAISMEVMPTPRRRRF